MTTKKDKVSSFVEITENGDKLTWTFWLIQSGKKWYPSVVLNGEPVFLPKAYYDNPTKADAMEKLVRLSYKAGNRQEPFTFA